MPKRIVDGDALWRSQKLSQVQPPAYRAEFANLIPLALANGVFEADPELVWATVYAYNRPDIGRPDVVKILGEFERVGLLMRWVDSNGIQKALNGKPPEGKIWGYWIGIEKPGRLPGQSRQGKNERVGPTPPKSMDSIERSADSIEQLTGTNLRLGLGSGSGSGSGEGKAKAPVKTDPEPAWAIQRDYRKFKEEATKLRGSTIGSSQFASDDEFIRAVAIRAGLLYERAVYVIDRVEGPVSA